LLIKRLTQFVQQPGIFDGDDGLARTVTIMAKVQLGKTLSDQDVSDVVAFLGSRTPVPLEEPSTASIAGIDW
jgi:hypothetical protein